MATIVHIEMIARVGKMDDGRLVTELNFPSDWSYRHAALVACDFVRHIAEAYHVDVDDVWHWVDRERHHPSTEIEKKH
jgi:hypothetical protein